jgi:S-DNA-T family DNA segregation ATPase FtsK/SpoIIIE
MAADPTHSSSRSTLASMGTLALCLFLWPAMVTFDIGDWPSPNQYPHNTPAANVCGVVGAWLAYQLHHYMGDGTYPVLLFATMASVVRLVRGRVGHLWERLVGVVLLTACTSVSAHLISMPGGASLPVGHGGVIGYALGDLLKQNLDRLGTLIVLASSLVVGLIFSTEGWVLKLPGMLRGVRRAPVGAKNAPQKAAAAIPIRRSMPPGAGVTTEESAALLQPKPSALPALDLLRAKRAKKNDESHQRPLRPEAAIENKSAPREGDRAEEPRSRLVAKRPIVAKSDDAQTTPRSAGTPGDEPHINVPSPKPAASAQPYPRQIDDWRLPSIGLLYQPECKFTAQHEQIVRRQAQVLEQTLEEFRLDARVVEIDTGPVITMFELKLGAGVKVSQIATLSNDIARALKAHAIRVVAPISGKNTVGVEVPNLEKEAVRLRELIMLAGKKASGMHLPLFLGKDAGGAPLVTDLTAMPHLLIAGTTGSGKSVCLNAVILSFLMTKRPDHVKMILVDPKMVELSQFKDVPHLMCPIVTDMPRAEKILGWAVTRMDERYELFAEARVKDIAGYNGLGADEVYARLEPETEEERARICTYLPYIVIVIDELADLMMTAAKEVEHHLSRLAQKSRAVGVHIIVATQRPEARVVTGLIKSNLPSRICFRVASRMDSRIVLDQNGGEVLLGQGDMLFLPPGSHKLVRAQGTYLDEGEVRAVLDDLASRARPEFHPELVGLKIGSTPTAGGPHDPLFDDAVRIMLQSRRGSVSLLQRRLTIGYARASRLIEEMAEAGIVGEHKGSQAREVLITAQQWHVLRKQLLADRGPGSPAGRGPGSRADRGVRANGGAVLWDEDAAEPVDADPSRTS